MIDDYAQKDRDAVNLRTEMILYAKSLRKELDRLQTEIAAGQEKFEQIEREQRQIVYEQLSYQIYLSEDQKTEILSQRAQQEIEITRLTSLKNHLLRKIDTYDLHKIYLELKEF